MKRPAQQNSERINRHSKRGRLQRFPHIELKFCLEKPFFSSDSVFCMIKKNDLPQCRSIILKNFFKECGEYTERETKLLEEIEDRDYIWSVATRDTTVVHAQLFMFREHNEKSERIVELCFAATETNELRRGYASSVVHKSICKWNDLNVTRVIIHSSKEAVEFWKKFEFQRVENESLEELKDKYDILDLPNTVVLEKKLQEYDGNNIRRYLSLDDLKKKNVDTLSNFDNQSQISLKPFLKKFNDQLQGFVNNTQGRQVNINECSHCGLYLSSGILIKHKKICKTLFDN